MAITWTKYAHDGRTVEKTWTTHEGLVVAPSYRRCERVMSDIYADVSYCLVWNAEKGQTETVTLGVHFELCSEFGHAEVDADASVLAEVERQRKAAEAAREAAEKAAAQDRARKAAEAAFNRPEKGKVMQVVRGRTVPKGTVGRVFWLDDLRNPSRVGLATTSRKVNGRYADVAWVNAEYLVNCDAAGPDYAAYGC